MEQDPYPESRPPAAISVANPPFQVACHQHQTIPTAGPGLRLSLGITPHPLCRMHLLVGFSYLFLDFAFTAFFSIFQPTLIQIPTLSGKVEVGIRC